MTPDDLEAFRHAIGLTQGEMARAIGAHINTYSQWERGVRSPSGAAVGLLTLLHWLHQHHNEVLQDWLTNKKIMPE